MDLKIISLLIMTALLTVMGLFVFFKNRKNVINIFYGFFVLFMAMWSLGLFMFYFGPENNMRFWADFLYVAGGLISSFFLYFSFVFPYKDSGFSYKKLLIFISNIFLFILIFFSDLIIIGVLNVGGIKGFVYGPLHIIFDIQFDAYFIWGFINLFNKYRTANNIARAQIKFTMLGTSLGLIIAGTTNVILPWFDIFNYLWIGPIAALIWISFTAYAIIAHHLMDIKLVLRSSFVYLLSFIGILIEIAMLYILIHPFGLERYGVVFFIIILAAMSSFDHMRKYLTRFANKYFFLSLYDITDIIYALSGKMRFGLNMGENLKAFADGLSVTFHPKAVSVFAYNGEGKDYGLIYNEGFDVKKKSVLKDDPFLRKNYIDQSRSVILEEVKNSGSALTKKNINSLEQWGASILLPLKARDRIIGLAAIGPKETGDMYNDDDLLVMDIIRTQAASAMYNALTFDEIQNYNIRLKDEIEKAVEKLTRANDDLRKLDVAKSEFISIASHQLRTPLTVIKGYISMMLEGNFGELNKEERDSLEKVFESNEKLIRLVENLLNISRIESGRLQFSYIDASLERIVDKAVTDVSIYMKKKNIKLIYKRPDKPLQSIKMDDDKIRQVVMNLMDNAFKYTKQGTITVTVKEAAKGAEFSVSDTGMGIREEEKEYLFKKFTRGKGTFLIHTEGTGLGLFIARTFVEAHHGWIKGESAGEGRGAKFTFWLPMKEARSEKLLVKSKK
jgi:signal transduction histidine kinase